MKVICSTYYLPLLILLTIKSRTSIDFLKTLMSYVKFIQYFLLQAPCFKSRWSGLLWKVAIPELREIFRKPSLRNLFSNKLVTLNKNKYKQEHCKKFPKKIPKKCFPEFQNMYSVKTVLMTIATLTKLT